jgi:hypothetical protein
MSSASLPIRGFPVVSGYAASRLGVQARRLTDIRNPLLNASTVR